MFIIVGPVLAFWLTKRLCVGLQRRDRELVLHGYETGRILRFADGEYVEVHKPLSPGEQWLRVQHEPRRPLQIAPETDSRGVLRRGFKKDRFRQRISQFFYQDRVEPVTPTELAAAHADASHDALEGGTGVHALKGAGIIKDQLTSPLELVRGVLGHESVRAMVNLSSDDMAVLLMCALFFLIARMMEEGRRLAEENRGFI